MRELFVSGGTGKKKIFSHGRTRKDTEIKAKIKPWKRLYGRCASKHFAHAVRSYSCFWYLIFPCSSVDSVAKFFYIRYRACKALLRNWCML